jgi:hypothetical protein
MDWKMAALNDNHITNPDLESIQWERNPSGTFKNCKHGNTHNAKPTLQLVLNFSMGIFRFIFILL